MRSEPVRAACETMSNEMRVPVCNAVTAGERKAPQRAAQIMSRPQQFRQRPICIGSQVCGVFSTIARYSSGIRGANE